jgi:hypothetical protein
MTIPMPVALHRQSPDCIDQTDVAESLGEVAQKLATVRIELFSQ